ncbi:uncharacterized protein N7506_008162 [Penicillium brevicompactum]|uniref:uncharacterized protein n=1 Tax=Penicillium brevicompactum TaxID=5074 RepID=UPI00253F7635|nr:uncharacterized protein N7506_008162 [Penicillium brevicompactum]KAJ5334379.1 hypothetical protein N7506_008162 [Penicillium brevicompactum]
MASEQELSTSFIPALYKPAALLPIARHKKSLLYLVENFPVTIVVGQTGSGKTTQLPQYLEQAGWCGEGKTIAVTQPRRVAATTVATRVAEEMHCKVGEEVGYSIRFEDLTSPATKIKFLTDGMLLREALVDPLLSRYSVIMVDEAHERSLSTDILLGILKKICKKRPELRIIVSSATLQAEDFLRFFAGEEYDPEAEPADLGGSVGRIISLEGRMYPVDMLFLESPAEDYIERSVKTVFDIHTQEAEGDILLFLTGREEIDTAIQLISERAATLHPKAPLLQPLPLYAGLTTEQQMYVFEPTPENTRKVIVSTNIAEASVTIDGIVYVIDCGFAKLRAYNPMTGIDTLTAVPISKASATQRAGRAGRTKPGKCFRLYTQQDYERMPDATVPEIQRSNLAPIIMQLKALGIDNIVRFDFLTSPPAELIIRALELLSSLGAVDDYAKLTKPLGMRMAEIALDPMMAKVVLAAPSFGCLSEILTIAAMVNLQGTVWVQHSGDKRSAESNRRKFAVEEGDHLTYLNVYQAFVTKGKKDPKWCRDNLLNYKALLRAVSIRGQLKRYLERFGIQIDETLSSRDTVDLSARPEKIRRCLTTGYFAHAAKMQPDGTFRTVSGGLVLHAHPSSLMFNRKADWVIFHEIMQTGEKTYIRDVTKIDKGYLLDGGCHGEDHDHSNDITPAIQSLLYSQVDFGKIITLNESIPKAGAAIVQKTWAERLNDEPELESDADEQLLMTIPFSGQANIHSVLLYTAPTISAPKTVKLFKNRDDLDFSMASELHPTQIIEVPPPVPGADVFELPLNRAHWNATTSVTLFFEDNWSNGEEDVTKVGYVGFKGQFMKLTREPVNFLYEAAANPQDHVSIPGVGGIGSVLPGQ